MPRDDALVLDIILAATDASDFVKDLDWNSFQDSRLHQNAVIRSLEIVGEAASKLSADFRTAHPEIAWRSIINLRHRLIHGYADVRLDLVWAVTQDSLPALVAALKSIAPKE